MEIGGSGLNWATQSWVPVQCGGRIACSKVNANNLAASYTVSNFVDLPVTISFTFGLPFDMAYSLTAYSDANATFSTCKNGYAGELESSADMMHSLVWGGISGMDDASGNALSDYSVMSRSGFDYQAQVATVPELESWSMLLTGVAGLALMRRRAIRVI